MADIKKPNMSKAPKQVKINRPSSGNVQQGYVKNPEPKQPELNQSEPKQSNKDFNDKSDKSINSKNDLNDFADEYKKAKPTESSKPQGLIDKVGTKAFNKGLKATDSVAKAKYGSAYSAGKKSWS